jgi:hypothetical protein
VAPGSADYQTSLLQEILAGQQASDTAPVPASPTGSWFAQNIGILALGVGGFVLMMALAKR